MISRSLTPPGDKSITHRALIFSSLAEGSIRIENVSTAADCRSTAECMKALGLIVDSLESEGGARNCLLVRYGGLGSLKKPATVLNVGNSGTTIRILAGLLAGLPFESILDGDESIRKRPMARVIEPLEKMGAKIEAVDGNFAPLKISGKELVGQNFELKVASAQVQTCLLLAGLQAQGKTSVSTPGVVRDHTERMFSLLGIEHVSNGAGFVSVEKLNGPAKQKTISVPADISSAAFFLVLAACTSGSSLDLNSIGLNPGRVMILDVLREMGASIEILNERKLGFEPVGDLRVEYSGRLNAITLDESRVPAGVDEIPILALACAFAKGRSVLKGLGELRHKESDRLKVLVSNLSRNGAQVEEGDDWISIDGKNSIKGGELWQTFGDHRMAMTGAIASLLFDEPVEVDEPGCAAVSYPEFYEDLESIVSG